MIILSERWLDEVMLQGQVLNVDGALAEFFTLPAGLGDVAIMEAEAAWSDILTAVALTVSLAARARVITASGNVVDILGISEVKQVYDATQYGVYWSPDPLVLWRQDEQFAINSPEFDSNAAPTADLTVRIKAVRVRPTVGQEARRPIRLVR